jgi:serine/threonine-protein kinase
MPAATSDPKKHVWIYVITVAAILSIGLFFLGRYSAVNRSAAAGLTLAKSIAVLPLVNTSGDPSNDYFSDGLSEELIAVLAKIPDLKTIGRNSAFAFKGKSDDSRTIGEKLGVAHLIEGSVRKQGERVRIVAELINAADGSELWSETYDRELKDVFAVQSEIATAVSEQLKVKLLGAPPKSDAAPSNNNLAAYNAWQQGTFYLQQSTEEGSRRAAEFFADAVRLDPGYALAYAGLSSAWRSIAASWAVGDEIAPAFEKSRSAAKRALSLAPKLAAAHEALGFLSMTPDLDFAAAEAEIREAEKLAPSDAGPKNALAYLLAAQGRLAEAEKETRAALAVDPLRVTLYTNLARILIVAGRYDEAEKAVNKALEIQPAAARPHTYLTTIAMLRGDAAAALKNAQLEAPGFWRDYAVTLATQAQSDRNRADASLREFEAKNSANGPFQIAVVYAFRKQPDKMFEWLERAYTERDSGLTQLFVTPFLLDYRADPRFDALCQKLKVVNPAAEAKRI